MGTIGFRWIGAFIGRVDARVGLEEAARRKDVGRREGGAPGWRVLRGEASLAGSGRGER